MGGFPFQPLQKSANRNLRRNGHQQVHMILRHMTFQYRHLVGSTDVADQISHPQRYLSAQRRTPVLRHPHQMQVNVEYCVRAPSILPHPLKLSTARLLQAFA